MPDTSKTKTVRETPLLNSVSVKTTSSYEVSETTLKVTLNLEFTPYDFTKYVFDKNVKDADKLNWITAVMYNYIPFALCKATKSGRYNSFSKSEFEEVNANWRIEKSTYIPKDNIIISDLNERAKTVFNKPDKTETEPDPWFNSMPGQQFAFNHAIPGSMYFDILTPIDGFNLLMDDPKEYENYLNWTNGTGKNKVTLFTECDISTITEEHTFAIVSANPYAQLLLVDFFTINKPDKKPKEFKLDIDPSSFYFYDPKIKTRIDQMNVSDKNIYLKLNSQDKSNTWSKTKPIIKFKVKKTYE